MLGLTPKASPARNKPSRWTTFKPRFEALERREVPSAVPLTPRTLGGPLAPAPGVIHVSPLATEAGVNLINSLPDTPVRSTALADYERDGLLTRNDLIGIFHDGTQDFTYVLPGVLESLNTLVSNGATVGMPDYVQILSSKVLAGVSGLGAGPAATLGNNVNNFFLGLAHPACPGIPYESCDKLPIWDPNTGPTYHDVLNEEGTGVSIDNAIGEIRLSFNEGLGAIARQYPGYIRQMFLDNGDGTYTVRVYNGGKPDYVTVDKSLPVDDGLPPAVTLGGTDGSSHLWAALAAKAYVQETTMDYSKSPELKGGLNNDAEWLYKGAEKAWSAFTGQTVTTNFTIDASAITAAWSQKNFVVLVGNGAYVYRSDGKYELFCGEYAVLVAYSDHLTVAPVTGTFQPTAASSYALDIPNSDLGDYFAGWYKAPPITIKLPPGLLAGWVASHAFTDLVSFQQTPPQTPLVASTTVTTTLGTQQTLAVQTQTPASSLPSTVLTTASPKPPVLSAHSLSDAEIVATFGNLDSWLA